MIKNMKHLTLLFCVLLFFGCRKEAPRQPNILVFIADDAGHMGSNEWLHTPSFDRIAAAGIRFTNAYTPNAKCAPSRASILTARNSWDEKKPVITSIIFQQNLKPIRKRLKISVI